MTQNWTTKTGLLYKENMELEKKQIEFENHMLKETQNMIAQKKKLETNKVLHDANIQGEKDYIDKWFKELQIMDKKIRDERIDLEARLLGY